MRTAPISDRNTLVIPRKQLDIGWTDLACGLAHCLLPAARDTLQNRLAQQWSSPDTALACLSVRSGFDLMLQHLALPRGSEILVSAITIRDMVTIIEQHGLRAVPVDIDPADCAMRCDLAEAAITPRTRAILIAHLFGSRMDMTDIIALARRHKLLIFEDCAQAYAADDYRGHPGSDVAMFSFGSIKTATALGGAMLTFRDASLCSAIRQMQRGYPVQSRWLYLRRIIKHACLKALAYRLPYTTAATEVAQYLPRFQFAGARNANHTHWPMPLLSTQPDRLVRHLIYSAVYLPIDNVSKPQVQHMANVILNFEAPVPSPAQTVLVHEM